ncbi:hypothetical protein IWZ03DRAFT_175375 [Phyllosticta citriasiana]|uniref:Uncharacterized protein n=1 Tax=Phyllosticta citriasiana TaxID=595635 RepID=A0ABR1KM74_9PEZI
MEMGKANRAMFIQIVNLTHGPLACSSSHSRPLLPAHPFCTLLLVVVIPSSVRESVASVLRLSVLQARSVPVSFCCSLSFSVVHRQNHRSAGNDVHFEASQTTINQQHFFHMAPPRVPMFWRWQGGARNDEHRSAAECDARPDASTDMLLFADKNMDPGSRDARVRVHALCHSRRHSTAAPAKTTSL